MAPSSNTTAGRRYHHGNLRSALIEAGLNILERGEGPFTLRAAAKQAGVSHTAPYNHFSDKDALLAAIAIRGFEYLQETTEAARQNAEPDAGDQLVATGMAYILFGVERPALYRLMFGAHKTTASSDDLSATGLAAFEVLVRVMRDGMASGVFRTGDARAAAFTVWSLVHGMAQMALDRTGPLSAEDHAGIEARLHAAHAIMMDGLRPR